MLKKKQAGRRNGGTTSYEYGKFTGKNLKSKRSIYLLCVMIK